MKFIIFTYFLFLEFFFGKSKKAMFTTTEDPLNADFLIIQKIINIIGIYINLPNYQ
jgi:hypothetical protein